MKNTTLCYIEKDNMYLMLHRTKKENDMNHDKWIGIGGKFEPGETPEQCMLREIKEETGLTATRYQYRGVVTFISDIYDTEAMHLYSVYGFTGETIECNEGHLEWIPKDKLYELTMWEGDKIFLNEIANPGREFFELELTYQGDTLTSAILDGNPVTLTQD
ncbi:MAG: 8-oxo-dGTP diphosphatase [Clostridia bacterium]|nr:8-oxo-dGTP diphosphatase [Clostridia bacterium]